MKNLLRYMAPICGMLAISSVQAGIKDECPAELVNFWKTFAVSTDNNAAIPVFLLENQCFRATGVSSAFHDAMAKRLDNPDDPSYVDQLYAQLEWTKPSQPENE